MYETATKAVMLLLALVVGGIALPLAHQVDHLLDAQNVGEVAEEVAARTSDDSASHECELCEARVTAVGSAALGAVALVTGDLNAVQQAAVVLPASIWHYDGRAPPTTA